MNGNQTAEQLASRWIRAQRALRAGDQAYAGRLPPIITASCRHLADGIGDPLEAAFFALLIDVVKELDTVRES